LGYSGRKKEKTAEFNRTDGIITSELGECEELRWFRHVECNADWVELQEDGDKQNSKRLNVLAVPNDAQLEINWRW